MYRMNYAELYIEIENDREIMSWNHIWMQITSIPLPLSGLNRWRHREALSKRKSGCEPLVGW